jgi:type IV secretory pathway TrbD component
VVVLPSLMLFGALLIAVMNSGAWLAALLGVLVWAVAAALIWFGRRSFERSRLATEM